MPIVRVADMDRDEALKLLKGGEEGIREWNHRRWAGGAIPDLTHANLSEANLAHANLSGADLRSAYLYRASLREANLRGADLSGADLSSADLRDANLRIAFLSDANLSLADLRNANLGLCRCSRTIFADVDLSEVNGLNSVEHRGPSTIGIDTLIDSNGKLPEVFLRGCGVPDALIEYLPSIMASMQPIQFYSCFISYSSKDQPFAERLYADLQGKGVRCWYAPEDLKIGEKIRVGIDESIRVHDKLLLVLSKNSVASDWVEKEVETAMEKERQQKRTVLFPIRLDDAVMKIETGWPADIRRARNIGDFKKWKTHDPYQKAFERLLRDLKSQESTGAKPV